VSRCGHTLSTRHWVAVGLEHSLLSLATFI